MFSPKPELMQKVDYLKSEKERLAKALGEATDPRIRLGVATDLVNTLKEQADLFDFAPSMVTDFYQEALGYAFIIDSESQRAGEAPDKESALELSEEIKDRALKDNSYFFRRFHNVVSVKPDFLLEYKAIDTGVAVGDVPEGAVDRLRELADTDTEIQICNFVEALHLLRTATTGEDEMAAGEGLRKLADSTTVHPAFRANILESLASHLRNIGEIDQSLEIMEEAVQIAELAGDALFIMQIKGKLADVLIHSVISEADLTKRTSVLERIESLLDSVPENSDYASECPKDWDMNVLSLVACYLEMSKTDGVSLVDKSSWVSAALDLISQVEGHIGLSKDAHHREGIESQIRSSRIELKFIQDPDAGMREADEQIGRIKQAWGEGVPRRIFKQEDDLLLLVNIAVAARSAADLEWYMVSVIRELALLLGKEGVDNGTLRFINSIIDENGWRAIVDEATAVEPEPAVGEV